jgi:hypothetical protein
VDVCKRKVGDLSQVLLWGEELVFFSVLIGKVGEVFDECVREAETEERSSLS